MRHKTEPEQTAVNGGSHQADDEDDDDDDDEVKMILFLVMLKQTNITYFILIIDGYIFILPLVVPYYLHYIW